MKTAETPVGIFTINKVKIPSAYTCAAEQKIEYISKTICRLLLWIRQCYLEISYCPRESVKAA